MNSSIFSSKPLRRWRGLPPRIHAWHALLALGALAMVAAASKIAADADRSGFRHQAELEGVESAELTVLGNSQVRFLDTSDFPIPATVMALPGSGFSMQAAVFLAHAPRMPDLKYLLLSFCNVPLRMPDIANREGDYQDLSVWGVPWYRIPCISFVDRLVYRISYDPLLKPLLVGPNFDIEGVLWERFRSRKPALPAAAKPEPTDPLDVIERGYEFAPSQGADKMQTYVRRLSETPQMEENRKAFFSILEYCERNGIEVVFLRTPTTIDYWTSRPESWDVELAALYQEARERHTRLSLPIWNSERAEQFPTSWFYDGNHMRPEALERYAEDLIDRLLSHMEGRSRDDGIESIVQNGDSAP